MRLPPHYVPRPRLTDRCAEARVVVVEAAAGFGKTVLGAALAESWGAVPITVSLERAEVPAPLLVARLRAAVSTAGYTEAASAPLGAGEDAVGAVDAMLAALADETCAFVVDDAHECTPDAAALLARIASRLSATQRLVVCARALPVGAERLRRAEYLCLDAGDLSLDAAETRALCEQGFGLDPAAGEVAQLHDVTGGWTAATVLAAARVARTGERLGAVTSTSLGDPGTSDAVGRILAEAVAAIGRDMAGPLAQLARLPLLDERVVDRATGVEGLFAGARSRGLPLTPARPPWWDLPTSVREHLVGLAPADLDTLRRAADAYVERGELRAALDVLVAADEHDAAAAVLATAPPALVEPLDVVELTAIAARIGDEALDRHPRGLVAVSRCLRVATRWDESNELLDRARARAAEAGDEALVRSVDAERAAELMRLLRQSEAQALARSVLDAAAPEERFTRTRASHVLAQSLCWQLDDSGRQRDERALDEATACFDRAERGYRELGMPTAAGALIPYWAISIELARGRARAALSMLEGAIVNLEAYPRRRGHALAFRAWVAAELGLDDVCRDSVDEVLRLATALDSDLLHALGHWKIAILESYRRAPAATLDHVREVERHKGGWWGPGSGDFLAEAADLLDRVGYVALAREYLERVQGEPKDAGHLVALSAAVLEARHGDPERAQSLLAAASATRIDPREHWRVTLLSALAAYRLGDHGRAGALAARAFEEAAALDGPTLPLLREAEATEQLLALALETGQPAARALEAASLPRRVAVLGRFELTVGGRPVRLGAGKESGLLKLVALGRRVHAESAIAAFWPDADPLSGRNRLRTVLNRLRAVAGEVVVREGDVLALADDVAVDLEAFQAGAGRARALAPGDRRLAIAVAREALARYRGEVLPDDSYEEWAAEPRDRARRHALDLLALCADEAADRGDLDEVRRLVERAIAVDPYDDSLYARAVTVLLEQGRRAEALSVLRRAHVAFDEIGLRPPGALEDLEATARA